MKSTLVQVMRQYAVKGVVKGGELLLPPEDALRLADELGRNGIAIMGVDGWRYLDKDRNLIQQDLGVDYSVPDDIIRSEDPVGPSIQMAKDYVLAHRHTVDMFSFTLDVPPWWALLPEHR